MFWLGATCGCTPRQRKATLAASSTTLLAVDWKMSSDYTGECREMNPMIGECGQRVPVNLYFPVVIAANLALGYFLGEAPLGVMTGLEGHVVLRNATTD
jgi:hypothetical protein